MNLEKIRAIKQKHLATKKALETEVATKAKEHEAAVEAFCEKLLQHLASDAAYDSEGVGNEYYKNTAWVEIAYSTSDYGGVVRGTTHIRLPKNANAEKLDYEYGEEGFMSIWYATQNKFEGEGFVVVSNRIVMKLEETNVERPSAVEQPMSAVEFIDAMSAMYHRVSCCRHCPLRELREDCHLCECFTNIALSPDELVSVVQKWAREHLERSEE